MQTFIARQPILDLNQKVYGYELLFRSGLENLFRHTDPDQATSRVLADSFFLMGIQSLTGGKRAFINVTRSILLKEFLYLVPKDQIVVEILETIQPDAEVVAACRHLKQAGYLLAMDDFVYEPQYEPLLDLTDFIKVDFLNTRTEEQRLLVRKLAPLGVRFIAEKVETQQSHREALEMGYTHFQGYFFSRPTIVQEKDIPGYKLHYFRILQEIHRPEINFKILEQIIKREVSLSYKLLRYINSAFFGLRNKITSILQALALLGEREVKKWVSLIALASMGEDKPEELVVQAIVRARSCELLAPLAGLRHRAEALFLLGMFSLIDAILDRPLPDLLQDLPVDMDIKHSLLGGESPLQEVYQAVLCCEQGDWDELSRWAGRLAIDEETIYRFYLDAVQWGFQCFQENN